MPNVILQRPGNNMIAVIKEVRALAGFGLKEAKDLVDSAAKGSPQVVVRDLSTEQAQAAVKKLQAAGAQAVVEAAGPKAVADEVWDEAGAGGTAGGGGFAVRLLDSGESKIAVIKVIRECTGLGLKEAKDLSEKVPSVIVKNVTQAQAQAACSALTREGARAELTGT